MVYFYMRPDYGSDYGSNRGLDYGLNRELDRRLYRLEEEPGEEFLQ